MRLAIRDQVEAALGALEKGGLTDLPADSLAAALTLMGDALRLELPMPVALRREADALPLDQLRAALLVLGEDVGRWSLPAVVDPDDDPALAWAIRRRDEIESAVLALRRILVPRGIFEGDIEEMTRLDERLAKTDLTCGGQVTRERADRCLEDRISLDGADAWMSVFPEAEAAPDSDVDEGELKALGNAGARVVQPSDAVVDEYVRRGALAKWVEASAAASADFAGVLESSITSPGARTVSIAALRWIRQHERKTGAIRLAARLRSLWPRPTKRNCSAGPRRKSISGSCTRCRQRLAFFSRRRG